MIRKSFATRASLTALMLAVGVVLGSGVSNTTINHNVDAQMMGGNYTGMMMKPGERMKMGMGMGGNNITSSINLMSLISNAIGSNINVSLSDAATTAESSVGNGSHAASAELGENNGYLVYNVMVIDPNMNFSKVVVDPGNGEVLFSKQLSKEEHMMMHGMGGQHMMMSPGMMMGGPGGMMKHDRMGMQMGPPGGMTWK
jgi:Peptidase propeptide and YPEB domain